MNVGIGWILKLLRYNRAGDRGFEFLGLGDSALHALAGWRQFQLRAKQSQHLATLNRHRFRHHENKAIPARRRHKGQRDAGITGSWFNQRRAGFNRSRSFQRIDHVDADTILDARDRIEKFELGQKIGVHAFLLGYPIQPHNRRIANRIGDRVIDAAAAGFVTG